MANGREAEAIAFLAKYHGNGNAQSRLVLLEVEEMREGIRQDGIDKSNFDCGCPHVPLLRLGLLTGCQIDLSSSHTAEGGAWRKS